MFIARVADYTLAESSRNLPLFKFAVKSNQNIHNSKVSIKILFLFPRMYLCKTGFSLYT